MNRIIIIEWKVDEYNKNKKKNISEREELITRIKNFYLSF